MWYGFHHKGVVLCWRAGKEIEATHQSFWWVPTSVPTSCRHPVVSRLVLLFIMVGMSCKSCTLAHVSTMFCKGVMRNEVVLGGVRQKYTGKYTGCQRRLPEQIVFVKVESVGKRRHDCKVVIIRNDGRERWVRKDRGDTHKYYTSRRMSRREA